MKKRFLPRARGGKLWNFSTPGFYVSPVPTSKAFYGTRGRDIMRAWRSKILKRIASPFLFLYLSYNSSRYEAARCSFTTRYVYIYILSIRTRTHLLFVPVQGELIITSVLRSPSKSLEERWRRWNFYFLFMREEDLAIFIELGKKNDKVSFIIICRP